MPLDLDLERSLASSPVTQPLRGWRARRVSLGERMFFTERLALLLDTGVALHAALATLESQAEAPLMRQTIAALHADVIEGKLLSFALARHPDVFPASYVSLVAAGERGGFVPQVLAQLIDLDDKSQRLRSTLLSAVSYPAFLTVFSVVILVIVLVYVFPKFGDLFANLGDRLPASTAFLMGVSTLLREHWLSLAAVLVAACAGVVHLLNRPGTRTAIDHFVLHAPGLRVLVAEIYLLQCLRVLALSLANGVSVVDALAASRNVVGNRVFAAFLEDVERRVSEGQTIAPGFEAAPFIPPLTRQMVATGEQSGRLGMVLGKLADFYQRDVERRLALAARLAEPVMLALMGGMVGLIVSALLLPVFRLSGAVH